MRFGVAKEIITPTFPVKLACVGDFGSKFTGVHDDVYARCLVMDDGNKKYILMSYDLLFHDRSLNDALAGYAKEKYNVGTLTVAYTHAHTSPASKGYNPNHHDDDYEELLISRGKSAIDKAFSNIFEGTLEYGSFDADFNVSRRGKENGEYVNAPNMDYPRDREFSVMCVRDNSGDIRSVVTVYACHPVFYPTRTSVSAEYPGRLCELIEAKYYGATALYFQSACGDVRPRPTVNEEKNGWILRNSFKEIDAFAQSMLESVSSFIDGGGCKKRVLSLAAEEFDITLEMDPKPLEFFIEMNKVYGDADHPEANNARYIAGGGYGTLEDKLTLTCQAVRVSDDFYIATVGGEPCNGVKRIVTSAFGEKQVCFIGYTDASAYIVDDTMLDEGGYEPNSHLEYCLIGPFKKGLDKKYYDAFTEHFEKIKK